MALELGVGAAGARQMAGALPTFLAGSATLCTTVAGEGLASSAAAAGLVGLAVGAGTVAGAALTRWACKKRKRDSRSAEAPRACRPRLASPEHPSVNDLQRELEQLRQEIAAQQAKAASRKRRMQRRLVALEACVAQRGAAQDALSLSVAAAETRAAENAEVVETLRSEVTALHQVAQHISTLESKLAEICTAQNAISTIVGSLERNAADASASADSEALQGERRSSVAMKQMALRVSVCEANVAQTRLLQDGLSANIEFLGKRTTELEDMAMSTQGEVSRLADRTAECEIQIAGSSGLQEGMSRKMAKLEQHVEESAESVVWLRSTVGERVTKCERQLADTSLQERTTELRATVEDVKTEVAQLLRWASNLETEIKQTGTSQEALASRVATAETRAGSAADAVADFRGQVDQLVGRLSRCEEELGTSGTSQEKTASALAELQTSLKQVKEEVSLRLARFEVELDLNTAERSMDEAPMHCESQIRALEERTSALEASSADVGEVRAAQDRLGLLEANLAATDEALQATRRQQRAEGNALQERTSALEASMAEVDRAREEVQAMQARLGFNEAGLVAANEEIEATRRRFLFECNALQERCGVADTRLDEVRNEVAAFGVLVQDMSQNVAEQGARFNLLASGQCRDEGATQADMTQMIE